MARTSSGLTRSEIQRLSDERRGVKNKSYTLPLEIIAEIDALSAELGITKANVVCTAIQQLRQSLKS